MAIVVNEPIICSPRRPVPRGHRFGVERTVARALDESPRVRAWVKNERLGFEIPYRDGQTQHHHVPDFLVELTDGTFLVVEVKGLEREQDRSKETGARRWIDAVNHWGKLGRWRYAKILSPHQLESTLAVDSGAAEAG